MLSVILKGQISSITTEKYGKQVCIPIPLLDTMIRDLKERKILIKLDSIHRSEISRLKRSNLSNDIIILQSREKLAIEQKKRFRNGVQRDVLIIITGVLAYLILF